MSMDQFARARAALNVLGKWRTLLTGWQLGTRPKGDPEGDAVRDHREVTLLLRAEQSALSAALLKKGVISPQEWADALEQEAQQLNADLEKRFPGVIASAAGLHIDKRALPWMKGWKP
jgi:hypothetical protein